MGMGEERVRCVWQNQYSIVKQNKNLKKCKKRKKNNRETHITICKIDSQWEFAAWLRKLKQGLCISLEGWDGEGEQREVQKGWDSCIPMADSC